MTPVEEILAEYERAAAKFAPMASAHEGWAVIHEEVDELWETVKANRGADEEGRAEAIQVAAMALRYVVDVCSAGAKAEAFRHGRRYDHSPAEPIPHDDEGEWADVDMDDDEPRRIEDAP